MTYDSKHYEFATTESKVPGPIVPPEGDRWTFISTSLKESTPILAVTVWARQKKL